MKGSCVALISLAVAVSTACLGCAPAKYVPKPNEELYGAWTNESYSGIMNWGEYAPQMTVNTPGTYADYHNVTDHGPSMTGKVEIASKWTDPQGYVWYKTFGSGSDGDKVFRFQRLERLSQSATVREFQTVFLPEFNPKLYPPAIDTNSSQYRIYKRVAK